MAIRGDSFGTVNEVTAYARHLLDGQSAFNSTTRPTLTEVEKFIDRASGVLNSAISGAGFAPSAIYANSTAKLACDDWVVSQATQYVELTQRGKGFTAAEGDRGGAFAGLYKGAAGFAKMYALPWKRLGVAVTDPAHLGLEFTASAERSQRADPSDSTLEQPKFRRGLFDNA